MFGRNRGFGKNQGQGRRQRMRMRLRDGSCQNITERNEKESRGFGLRRRDGSCLRDRP
jgi:hypothetical protein